MAKHPPQSQALSALLGLALLIGFGVVLLSSVRGVGNGAVDIAVEHSSPLTLTLTLSLLPNGTLIEVENTGEETIGLSVPAGWNRQEVRKANLEDVTAGDPEFGFRRWSLPGKAHVSFAQQHALSKITLHNPSGVQLTVRFTHIDLGAEEVTEDVVLVQEGPVALWEK